MNLSELWVAMTPRENDTNVETIHEVMMAWLDQTFASHTICQSHALIFSKSASMH